MSPAKILLVEDKITHRLYIGDVLRTESYEVVEAGNLSEARQLLQNQAPFHLIILDQMLPDGTGSAFFAEIRKDKNLKHLPVLFITAYPEDGNLSKIGKQKGVKVLAKPVRNYADILDWVKELLH